MLKAFISSFVALAITGLAAASANAATLGSVQGQVMVNRGNGYRFVSGTVELAPGDMVIANSGATAQLFYPDGCTVVVEPGSVVSVASQSPCATETNTTSGPNFGTLAVGALVVGGGVAAAMLLSQGHDKGSSP